MPSRRLVRLAAIATLSASVLLTVSCASTPEPEQTEGDTAHAPVADPAPGATPEPEQTTDATQTEPETVPTTCDSLISADLVADLEAQDWTFEEEPFTIGEATFTDGLSCTWGDFSTATGNVLIFAWAPLTADENAAAQAQLEEDGWIREDGDAGVYFTEDPMQALNVDENGYGMTYLFGDEWVTLSDTKQGLLMIERPTA